MTREPLKYIQVGSVWRLNPEWRAWFNRKGFNKPIVKVSEKPPRAKAPQEKKPKANGKVHLDTALRLVSYAPSGKEVYFCYCLPDNKSCGTVMVRDKPGAKLREVK